MPLAASKTNSHEHALQVPQASWPLSQRYWDRVNKTETCWLWTGAKSMQGRGTFTQSGRKRVAARYMYEAVFGPVQGKRLVHTVCGTKHCVNPRHLECITYTEFIGRHRSPFGINARKTACQHGHPFDEVNTVSVAKGRVCRECRRLYNRKYRPLRKDKASQLKQERDQIRQTARRQQAQLREETLLMAIRADPWGAPWTS